MILVKASALEAFCYHKLMLILVLIALLILTALTVFQILLIAGKPLGEYVWGGQHKVLPTNLRISSVTSIILYALFMIFLVSKAGLVQIIAPGVFLDTTMWIFTGYFFLGILVNALSRSKKERFVMVPTCIVLALVFLTVMLTA